MPFTLPALFRFAVRLVVTVVTGVITAPLAGQTPASSELLPAGVEMDLGWTEAAGVTTGMAGGTAAIRVGARFRIGVGAWSLLRRVDRGLDLQQQNLDFGVGYGGALVEYRPGQWPISARLLVGGGVATLRTVPVGTPFDTETFVVFEPALSLHQRLVGPLQLGARVAYRSAHAVDPRFLIGPEGLQGFSGAVLLRIGG